MHELTAILSNHTCGEACWYAREETCRCICKGKNHGCLTLADGQKPERNCRHNGVQYKLAAIGDFEQINAQCYEINEQAWQAYQTALHAANAADTSLFTERIDVSHDSERCPAAYTQNATKTQMRWIEVAGYCSQNEDDAPVLLWTKIR